MTSFSFRLASAVYRLPALVLVLWPLAASAQSPPEKVSPLPPPVTRAIYRAHWFDLLSAMQELDARATHAALAEMQKTARAAGVRRLSGYSRTALHEARRAERSGRIGTAGLAYEAAAALDDSSFDAAASRLGFLVRRGRLRGALSETPEAFATLFASEESRLSLASSLAVVLAIGIAATAFAAAVGLFLVHFRRLWHDVRERASRPFGYRAATPLAFALLALPVFFALGPVWLLLYWGGLAYAYGERRERALLAIALVSLGLTPLLVDSISRENLVRRSPLYVAAVDLAERRDDASVEDGLASLAAAYPDHPDAWFLLARYAERAGEYPRALAAYGRAIQADPKDYRPFVDRGNVRFVEGDFVEAISDYEEAARRAPEAAEAFYNLSVARSEVYDFKGQEAARARAVQISRRDVDAWSSSPPLARVVPAAYRVSSVRERVRTWTAKTTAPGREERSRPDTIALLLSPWCLAPWGALIFALAFSAVRSRRGLAIECSRCGRPFCRLCKRYGGPALYCGRCVRLYARKEEVAEGVRDADRRETRKRARRRRRLVRGATLLLPGVHRFFAGRPYAAAAILFVFFLAVELAALGWWPFELRPLAPSDAALPGRTAAAAVALGLWLTSNLGAWRQTRES